VEEEVNFLAEWDDSRLTSINRKLNKTREDNKVEETTKCHIREGGRESFHLSAMPSNMKVNSSLITCWEGEMEIRG
jgi:hypothetical protein